MHYYSETEPGVKTRFSLFANDYKRDHQVPVEYLYKENPPGLIFLDDAEGTVKKGGATSP